MVSVLLRINNQYSKLIRNYPKMKKTSVYVLMRDAKIKEAIQVENFDRILASTKTTYSLDAVKKELSL